MAKHSKRYKQLTAKIDKEQKYTVPEALDLLKSNANAKFVETVDIAIKLGVNPKKADEQVRGTVVLPHGTGKEVKVLTFAKGEKAKEAEAAGSNFVGAEEMAEKIQKENWTDFDAVVATPDMMKIVGRLGRVLGPRGLMPNPKTGTVTMNIKEAIEKLKAGQVEYKLDKYGIIRTIVGKVDFESNQLIENTNALLKEIIRAKPSSVGGRKQYMNSITVSSTMGPGFKIDINQVWNDLA